MAAPKNHSCKDSFYFKEREKAAGLSACLLHILTMSHVHSTEKLLEGTSIRRLILQLGIPAMLGQFFNILYSIVDRIFVGKIPGVGETALASIGVCAPALTAISAFAYMVGIGGASSMSILLGRKDPTRAKAMLGNAVFLLLFISVMVTVLLLLVKRPFLYILGCSDAMYPYASIYFTIAVSGTLASLLGTGLNQFLLAQGFAKPGMISVVMGAVINACLDPLLIFGCGMGIAGAAVATVIAQCCMAAYVIWQLCSDKVAIRFHFCRPQWTLCRRILAIGSMSFLITILDNLIIILLNIMLRQYGGANGDQLITCATIVQSFLTIVFCPAQGIITGCSTIFSYHYGAGHYQKIRQTFLGVFVLCALYIGALQIAVQLAPHFFVGLFLPEGALSQQGADSLRLYTLALLGVAVQYALVDGLTAMGKVRWAFPLSVFRKIVYVLCLFVLPNLLDIRYIFSAGSISDAIGATFSAVVFFLFVVPRLKRELAQTPSINQP